MVTSGKSRRVKFDKRSTTDLGDDTISRPRLLSTTAIPRSDLQTLEHHRVASFRRNQRSDAKVTSSAKRRRPKLRNANSSAGRMKIIYLPPAREAAIGVALGSPSQEWSFEPSRSPPLPGRIKTMEGILRPPTRAESAPDIRLRPSRWKSFGGFFGKRSASLAAGSGQYEDVPAISGSTPTPAPPSRFPIGAYPSSTSSLPKRTSEESESTRPALVRGTSSSIAAPQQVQASDKEHVDQFLPGLPGSVQAATADLLAISKRIQHDREAEEKRNSEGSDRNDSVLQTPSDNGNEPSPLPPPKDEGYLAKKSKKPAHADRTAYIESIGDLDTMKEAVLLVAEKPGQMPVTDSPKKIERLMKRETPKDETSREDRQDSDVSLEVKVIADEKPRKDQKHSNDVKNGPWLDVVIPRIEMERYSIMFGTVLKRDREQDLPQGLPQGLRERRQAQLDKNKVASPSLPKAKEPGATGDIIPKSAGHSSNVVALSLFPQPLKRTKSTKRPKPDPLVRSHTSPKLKSPLTSSFLNTTPSTAMSLRSWSHDNILLATPASRQSFDEDDEDDGDSAANVMKDSLPVRPKPAEPQWEMMTRTATTTTLRPGPRIGLPSSVRPVKSGVYTAKRAEMGNAREVSFARMPKLVMPTAAAPNASVVQLVDTNRTTSQVGQVEGVGAS